MNILCPYKKNRDEKTFFVTDVKKKNLRRSKMSLSVTFICLFYTGHIKCLFDAKLFCTDRYFSYEHPKNLFEFF